MHSNQGEGLCAQTDRSKGSPGGTALSVADTVFSSSEKGIIIPNRSAITRFTWLVDSCLHPTSEFTPRIRSKRDIVHCLDNPGFTNLFGALGILEKKCHYTFQKVLK